MSVLGKHPFIEELLGALSNDEILAVQSLINAKGEPETMHLAGNMVDSLPSSTPATVAERVKLIHLVLNPNSIYTGILVYHSPQMCGLIGTVAFVDDILKLFKLDIASRKAIPMDEKLTADELRRVLDDTIESKGIAAGEVSIEVVNSLPASGVEDRLYLSGSNAQSSGGVIEFPEPTVADEGKTLLVNSSGEYELSSSAIDEAVQWADVMKGIIAYSDEFQQTICAGQFYSDSIALQTISDLINDDEGEPFFPSLLNQAGKFVKVNDDETGFEYGSGGTQLYKHYISVDGEYIIIVTLDSEEAQTANDIVNLIRQSISTKLSSSEYETILFADLSGSYDLTIGFLDGSYAISTLTLDAQTFEDEVVAA